MTEWTRYLKGGAAPRPRSLVDVLTATVEAHPGAVALDVGSTTLTYREFSVRVTAVAEALRAGGVGPGRRCGVQVASGTADLYVSIAGVIMAGAAYVPVDFEDGESRVRQIFDSADVDAVVTADGVRFTRQLASVGALAPALDDDAWIIFTSGSTGQPKGVAIHHRAAAAFVDAEVDFLGGDNPISVGDRVAAGFSVAFDSSAEEMWLAWRTGATLVPFSRDEMRSGPDLGSLLRQREITVLSTSPSVASLFADEDVARLRVLIVGGEACSDDLSMRLLRPGREVWNSYGPTEATIGVTFGRLAAGESVRLGPALAGADLAVLDEAGVPVATGGVGELVIAGVGLGRYLDEAQTEAAFRPVTALGWERAYYTGDFVELTPTGLRWVGRRDDQVKVSGRRIELSEVEAATLRVAGVREAAATVREVSPGVKQVVCYVTLHDGAEKRTAGDVSLSAAASLPAGVRPLIAVVDEMPRLSSGKVDRSRLPWPCGPAPAVGTSDRLHEGPIHEAWAAALGLPYVDDDTDFFAAGGTSMGAAQMTIALREHYPSVTVADVYKNPRLGDFAATVDVGTREGAINVPSTPVRPTTAAYQLLVVVALFAVEGTRWLAVLLMFVGVFEPELLDAAWWATTGTLAATFLTVPGRVMLTGLVNRALTWRLGDGPFRKGGFSHMRLWTADRLGAAMGVGQAAGTPWMATYGRLVRCTIGRNAQLMSVPPATGRLWVGDNAVLEGDVRLSAVRVVGDEMWLEKTVIGNGARIGTRAALMGSITVGEGAEVLPQSLVHRDVPAGVVVGGSPARVVEPGYVWPATASSETRFWRMAYSMGPMLITLVSIVAAVPEMVFFEFFAPFKGSDAELLAWLLKASPVLALLAFVSYAVVVAVASRMASRVAVAGLHRVSSRAGFASWFVESLADRSRGFLTPLYSSMLTPFWLRALGAKVGRRVEASVMLGQFHLMTLGDGAFLADDASLAQRQLARGYVHLAPSEAGARSFVGNSAYVPAGRRLPDDVVLAVASCAPERSVSGTSYFGDPALEYPSPAFPAVHPTRRQLAGRAAFEIARVLPLTFLVVLEELAAMAMYATIGHTNVAVAVLVACVAFGGVVTASLLASIAAKWLLQGRLREGEYPFWGSVVWRGEFMWAVTAVLAYPWLVPLMPGTPVTVWFLRALGAKVGRGVWCEIPVLGEPDIVTIGDGASLGRASDLQTHVFRGFTMQVGRIDVRQGASLGTATFVLPNVTVGAYATVAGNSVVPRGEHLADGSAWWGHPVVRMTP